MRARAAALASEPVAEAAANEHLTAGGGALDAVLAGVFAAGGNAPGVLLGPLTILIGGVGQGARALDGRLRQPGLGAKRPRGFVAGETVPEAARVAAPAALAAALVAHAYGTASLRSIVRAGIVAAERANAPERARVLERVAQVGASALSEAAYRRGLLRVASASEGGVLTPRDLEPPQDIDVPATELMAEGGRMIVAPWASEVSAANEAAGRGAAVAAIDIHGLLATALYRVADVGLWIEELQMVAPLVAAPVQRGVPRVSPGTRLPTAAPALLRFDEESGGVELVVEPESTRLNIDAPGERRWTLRRNSTTRLVESLKRHG
jgi:hypothetical protein